MVGIHRAPPSDYAGDLAPLLDWTQNDDGSASAALTVNSPGAASIRLTVVLTAPEGAALRAYDASGDQSGQAHFIGKADHGDVLWLPSAGGESATLEVNRQPPEGAVYAGWTTDDPYRRQNVYAIDHPLGERPRTFEGDADEGFNEEPVCERQTGTAETLCWTLTKGYADAGAHVADLGYACSDSGREMLGISFHARGGAAFTAGNVVLAVRWDQDAPRSLATVASATRQFEEAVAYLYAVRDAPSLLRALGAQHSLAVALPYHTLSTVVAAAWVSMQCAAVST